MTAGAHVHLHLGLFIFFFSAYGIVVLIIGKRHEKDWTQKTSEKKNQSLELKEMLSLNFH